MKLGVMAALFGGMDFDSMLRYCAEIELDAVELPAGGYPGRPFFEPEKVLASQKLQGELKAKLADHGLELSGLAVHHDIIEMLHLIGAEDGYIARQFQGHAMKLGLVGAIPGVLLAVLTIELLAIAAGRIDAFLLPNIRLAPAQWAALALVPLAAALIAMLTARLTVMRRLSGMT